MRERPFRADGKLDVVVVREEPREDVLHCQECGARGPAGDWDPEHAGVAWNQQFGWLSPVR